VELIEIDIKLKEFEGTFKWDEILEMSFIIEKIV
jgi:hypothetical protein